MRKATRFKETIAGVPVETFPSTREGKYERKYRSYWQTFRGINENGKNIMRIRGEVVHGRRI